MTEEENTSNSKIPEFLKRIGYYLILPVGAIAAIIGGLFYALGDFEKSVNLSATIIQTLAIFIGGLWAYHKFGWQKKAESAIKLKSILMEYQNIQTEAYLYYEYDSKENGQEKAYLNYLHKIESAQEKVSTNIDLSVYLPRTIREKIEEATWFAFQSPTETFEESSKKFHTLLTNLKQELDKFVSK